MNFLNTRELLSDKKVVLWIFGSILLLYLLTMQTGFFWGDPVDEVNAATATERFFPPQHLISSTVNAGILSLLGVNQEPTSFLLLQVIMALATLSGAWGFFLLLRRFVADRIVLFGGLTLYLLANGVWFHSTTVETGAIPLALLVWSCYWLLRSEVPTRNELILAFSFVSLSVLFNLQQGLFVPVFLFYSVIRLWGKPAFVPSLCWIGGTIVLAGTIPYLLIAVTAHEIRSTTDFISWLTYHPNAEEIGKMRSLGLESFARSVAGLFSLVVDQQGATSWLKFRMRGETGVGMNLEFIVRLVIPALILAVLLFNLRLGVRREKHVGLLSIVALAGCFLFGVLWLGSDAQFWLPIWPLFLLSAAIGLSNSVQENTTRRRIVGGVFAVCLLVLFVLNIPRGSPSILFPNGGIDFQSAQKFAGIVEEGDLVIASGTRWSDYIEELCPHVELINLRVDTNALKGIEGGQLVYELRKQIEHTLSKGNDAYVEGGIETADVLWLSTWEGFRIHHNLTRRELMEGLRRTFRLSPLPDYQFGGMAKIVLD